MSRTTLHELNRMIEGLNERYGLNDDTKVQFVMGRAYGGHKLDLRYKKSGGRHDVTYGFVSKRELKEAIYNLNYDHLDYLVNKSLNDNY